MHEIGQKPEGILTYKQEVNVQSQRLKLDKQKYSPK